MIARSLSFNWKRTAGQHGLGATRSGLRQSQSCANLLQHTSIPLLMRRPHDGVPAKPTNFCTSSSLPASVPKYAPEPPATPGMPLDEVDTPALLVSREAFERNCQAMKAALAPFPHVKCRPHAKAHKCAELAALQQQLLGAHFSGVCCQTVAEAEAMVAGGIRDVLLSNQVVPPAKVKRLAALAKKADVAVCVDSAGNLRALSRAAEAAGTLLRVLVEVNVGQDRCGVDTVEAAVELGVLAAALPGLRFGGIQAYHGLLQHVADPAARAASSQAVAARAREVAEALEGAGLECSTVTGGGTGTFLLEAGSGVYTEVQPGSFFFGDVAYGRNLDAEQWQQSLLVLTTVISVSEERQVAVCDAGMKAVSYDSGPPLVHAGLPRGERFSYSNGGDEHGIVQADPEVAGEQAGPAALPSVGDMLTLIPGHVDPTMNLHDYVVITRAGEVEAVWPINGRGSGC